MPSTVTVTLAFCPWRSVPGVLFLDFYLASVLSLSSTSVVVFLYRHWLRATCTNLVALKAVLHPSDSESLGVFLLVVVVVGYYDTSTTSTISRGCDFREDQLQVVIKLI